MTWTVFALEPNDTLLFRDGRPFDQSDEGLTEATSMFPPFPSVVAGALRVSLARANGFSGSAWNKQTFGEGPLKAGLLRFGEPVLLRAIPMGGPSGPHYFRPLFRCPAPIFGRTTWDARKKQNRLELALVRPTKANRKIVANLGAGASLPLLDVENRDDFTALDDWVIDEDGLRSFLAGVAPNPESVSRIDKLVKRQARAGLTRDYAKHGAVPGKLYSASHVRLEQRRVARGSYSSGIIAIGIAADLSPLDARTPDQVLPLGSHGRAVKCSAIELLKSVMWPDLAKLSMRVGNLTQDNGFLHYAVTLLSPAIPLRDGSPLELPDGHELVSAVVPKPIAFSGWNAAAKGPADMRRHFAPGSTWYLRCPRGKSRGLQDELDRFIRDGIGSCGQSVGFGRVVIGTWRHAETST
jgi:CRISPR-associated protein Cmr3